MFLGLLGLNYLCCSAYTGTGIAQKREAPQVTEHAIAVPEAETSSTVSVFFQICG